MRRLLVLLLAGYRRARLLGLRLRGRTPDDAVAARIVSGRSWDEFCDACKAAGAALHVGRAPRDPASQAEGYRYLSRLVRAGLEAFVEHGDPHRPVLRRMVHETIKLGADNPDADYRNAPLDPRCRYLLKGRRGTVHQLGFSTQSSGFEDSGRRLSGHLDVSEIDLGPDGSFEIVLGGEPRARNWLAMDERTDLLLVRQVRLDRSREVPAELELECLDGEPEPGGPSPAAVDRGLTRAATLVAGASMMFARWSDALAAAPNTLPRFDQARSDAAGGDPGIAYYHGVWRLEPGQALVVELMPPECEYWNFQLNDYWMESLDYVHHRIAVNKREARVTADGSVRIVACALPPSDGPAEINWLETGGRRIGTMTLRWSRARHHPSPRVRVVDVAELMR